MQFKGSNGHTKDIICNEDSKNTQPLTTPSKTCQTQNNPRQFNTLQRKQCIATLAQKKLLTKKLQPARRHSFLFSPLNPIHHPELRSPNRGTSRRGSKVGPKRIPAWYTALGVMRSTMSCKQETWISRALPWTPRSAGETWSARPRRWAKKA